MSEPQVIKEYLASIKPTLGGKFLYYCLPFRKKVVLQNLHRVFSKVLTAEEIHKLALCFYSHIATSCKENFRLRFMSQQAMQEQAEVIGSEELLALSQQGAGSGILILTGHFGNWELAPIAGILNFRQFQGRFHFVRKTLSHKWFEKILFRRYYQAGLQVIPKKNALFPVCDALDQKDAVVFVLDQHAGLNIKDGIRAEFFGIPAGTYRSLALIARYTGVPVVPACSYRKPNGKHVLQFYPPLPWQSAATQEEEIYLNTLAYNQALEKMILAHPEQWLWMHKRWKL